MQTTSSDDATIGGEVNPPPPWQFSLRGMMIVSTAASVVAAVVAWRGPGAAVLATGLLVCLANSLGWLQRWQSRRARPKWLACGWLLFVVSLFLPAAEGCGREPIRGGTLAWTCVTSEVEALVKVTTSGDDRTKFLSVLRETPLKALGPHAILLTITETNVILLGVPALWWAWRRERAGGLFACVYAGAILAWLLTWSPENEGMLYGFYVWSASFLVTLCAQRIPWSHQRVAACVLILGLYGDWLGAS